MIKYFTTVKNQEHNILFAGIVSFENDAASQIYKNEASAGGNTVLLILQPAD